MENRIKTYAPLIQKYDSPISVAVRIAQGILESRLFQSELAQKANNGFGIKASAPWTGDKYSHLSGEVGGSRVSEFRKYPTQEASIKDHAGFFTSTEYRADTAYKKAIEATNYKDEANALTGIYAGDPQYGKKLISAVEKYNLTQYDKKGTDNVAKRNFADVMKQVYGTEVINWDGFKGIGAGRRNGNPEGAIIHNDYGRADGKGYINWLTTARIPRPTLGYAHYYIDRKWAVRAVPTYQGAWHAGDGARGNFTGHGKPANYGNMKLLGYEVNESLSTTNTEFRLNEEVVFIQVADDAIFYGWDINRSTIWLHNQFSNTSCPHRSWELHVGRGATYNQANRTKLQDYFIGRVKFWVRVLNGELPIPAKNYLPETHGDVKPIEKPAEVVDERVVALPEYSEPTKPFKELEVGDKDTIRTEVFNFWYRPHMNDGYKPSEDVRGAEVTIKDKMVIEDGVSYSKRAYLVEEFNSWVLEQDLSSPRSGWANEKVEEQDELQNYIYWDGKKYKIGNEVK